MTPRKLTRSELEVTVNKGVKQYTGFWADIHSGWKPSEEFGPEKNICLLLQDLGVDDTLAEQAGTVFHDDFNTCVPRALSNHLLMSDVFFPVYTSIPLALESQRPSCTH